MSYDGTTHGGRTVFGNFGEISEKRKKSKKDLTRTGEGDIICEYGSAWGRLRAPPVAEKASKKEWQ